MTAGILHSPPPHTATLHLATLYHTSTDLAPTSAQVVLLLSISSRKAESLLNGKGKGTNLASLQGQWCAGEREGVNFGEETSG